MSIYNICFCGETKNMHVEVLLFIKIAFVGVVRVSHNRAKFILDANSEGPGKL